LLGQALSLLPHALQQGSTFIDVRFCQLLRNIVGSEVYDAWAAERPKDLASMLATHWETKKRLHTYDTPRDVEIPLPVSLHSVLPQSVRDKLAKEQVTTNCHTRWHPVTGY
jgi:hypothetical protein